ncbi:MAG: sulfatase-like hydrolase/transferase, partial [Candidatus Marinimicrobia bacterium]|nr:sulfatase-like hydrolase/transferase [Candidatus Neomarinimicrobiota bacterium]
MSTVINRRRFLQLMGAGVAALNFPLLSCSNGIPENPNIIFILADDLGYGDLSSQNNHSKIPTPRMDELASQGMRFTDAHSNSAVCTPTRYGVLTGRYSWRTRLKSGVLWGYSRPL